MWPFKEKAEPPLTCPRECPRATRFEVYSAPNVAPEVLLAYPGEHLVGNVTEKGLWVRRAAIDGWVNDAHDPAVGFFANGCFTHFRVFHDNWEQQ